MNNKELPPTKREFYAGFKQGVSLTIGDRVFITGDHPHAGKSGEIKQVIMLFGKPAVEVRFDDGDGCFVTDPGKHGLRKERRIGGRS